MEVKSCSMCKVEKLLSEFFRDRTKGDGRNSHCKMCDYSIPRGTRSKQGRAEYMREYRKKPEVRERMREYQKEYRKEYRQRPEVKAKARRYDREYKRKRLAWRRTNDPEYRKYKAASDKRYRQTLAGRISSAKAKAKRRAKGSRFTLCPKEWLRILEAFDNACAYCGLSDSKLTIDHFIPLAKGGHSVIGNLVPACQHCNSSKQDKMPQEWCNEDQLRCVLDIMVTI